MAGQNFRRLGLTPPVPGRRASRPGALSHAGLRLGPTAARRLVATLLAARPSGGNLHVAGYDHSTTTG